MPNPPDRPPSDVPDYSGMTLNERLVVGKLLQEFDAAARRRDRAAMIDLLLAVAVDDPQQSVDSILADPQRYGF